MLRRRSAVTLVVITVIAIIVATVAVIYAVQNILDTREVSATVTILSSGTNLAVCTDSDTNCTVPFSGPLGFGFVQSGKHGDAAFRIKNVALPPASGDPADVLFVDARIRFDNRESPVITTVTPMILITNPFETGDIPAQRVLRAFRVFSSGDVLGEFWLRHEGLHADTALQPGEVRRVIVEYIAPIPFAPQMLNFDLLVDAVDVVE